MAQRAITWEPRGREPHHGPAEQPAGSGIGAVPQRNLPPVACPEVHAACVSQTVTLDSGQTVSVCGLISAVRFIAERTRHRFPIPRLRSMRLDEHPCSPVQVGI